MAGKTLIGGTAYTITGGKALVGGTAYGISKGKTLVGGTAYNISFGNAKYSLLYSGTFTSASAVTRTLTLPSNAVGIYHVKWNSSNGTTGYYQTGAMFLRNGNWIGYWPNNLNKTENPSVSGTTFTYSEQARNSSYISNPYWFYVIKCDNPLWTDGLAQVSGGNRMSTIAVSDPSKIIACVCQSNVTSSTTDFTNPAFNSMNKVTFVDQNGDATNLSDFYNPAIEDQQGYNWLTAVGTYDGTNRTPTNAAEYPELDEWDSNINYKVYWPGKNYIYIKNTASSSKWFFYSILTSQ